MFKEGDGCVFPRESARRCSLLTESTVSVPPVHPLVPYYTEYAVIVLYTILYCIVSILHVNVLYYSVLYSVLYCNTVPK